MAEFLVNKRKNYSGGTSSSHLQLQVLYQTQKTVFDHISKHREESWKYDA